MSGNALTIKLVPALVGRSDASRLIRELEGLDNTVTASNIRHQQVDTSRVTGTLSELAAANSISLSDAGHRNALKQQLKLLKTKGTVLHVTFAEEVEPEIMQQITAWVREQLHPQALLRAGLQPGIVAGCVVRTPSHIYDFSISSILKAKRPILTKLMQGLKDLPQPDSVASPTRGRPDAQAPAASTDVPQPNQAVPQGAAA